jgi:autotransporter-associated beta strand protein
MHSTLVRDVQHIDDRSTPSLHANVAAVLLLLIFATTGDAAIRYWDGNGTQAGAGVAPTGTWGSSSFWSSSAAGTGSTSSTLGTSNDAVFSAGDDATGPWTLAVSGTQTAASVLVEEGNITLSSGIIDTGSNTFTIGTGAGSTARVNIDDDDRFNNKGSLVLNGGTLFNSSTSGGAFIRSGKFLRVTASGGTIGYTDGSPNNSLFVSFAETIQGVGGTISNGGVGTLTKTGPDEFRYEGDGTADTTYAKLIVKEGLFRLGSVTSSGTQLTSERGFGAAPTAPLSDAITLDGGAIGAEFAVTLHQNRGVTIGPGGGTINVTLGSMTIPSLVSGSGTLTISGTASHTATLSHAGNANAFSGALVANGRLALNSSLNVKTLAGSGLNSIITVNAGSVLGVGNSDTADAATTFAGIITGSGGLAKTGSGTLALTSGNTYAGGTLVSGGMLLANNAAGSATGAGTVIVDTSGILGGNGFISGNVEIGPGGTISPGAAGGGSIGTLTTASQTWEAGGSYFFDVDPASLAHDLISLGSLAIEATAATPFAIQIARVGSGLLEMNEWITIAVGTGVIFDGFDASKFMLADVDGQQPFAIRAIGGGADGSGSGFEIQVSASPEPGTTCLFGAGLSVLLMQRWRRLSAGESVLERLLPGRRRCA